MDDYSDDKTTSADRVYKQRLRKLAGAAVREILRDRGLSLKELDHILTEEDTFADAIGRAAAQAITEILSKPKLELYYSSNPKLFPWNNTIH